MVLFHGTAAYNEPKILRHPCTLKYHHGLPRKCLCTSLSFDEAALFALRKTPISDMSKVGIIIEFEADLADSDFTPVASHGLLRDEKEIAVFNTKKLIPKAVWRLEDDKWVRYPQSV